MHTKVEGINSLRNANSRFHNFFCLVDIKNRSFLTSCVFWFAFKNVEVLSTVSITQVWNLAHVCIDNMISRCKEPIRATDKLMRCNHCVLHLTVLLQLTRFVFFWHLPVHAKWRVSPIKTSQFIFARLTLLLKIVVKQMAISVIINNLRFILCSVQENMPNTPS